MNLDLDFSAVPQFFRGVLNELRQKRLWPVAAVLVAAIVAVPFLLGNSGTPPVPQPEAQVPTPPPAASSSIPALSVQSTPSHARLSGTAHDPFATGATTAGVSHGLTSGATATSTVTSTSTVTNPVTGGANSTGSSTGSSAPVGSSTPGTTGSSSTVPTGNPPSITPGAKPKPAPSGLKSNQAYDVSLAITVSNGGINTTDPLERLSVIPGEQQPLLVELGVERGGNHVLFAVQPGAIPVGPGRCTPGPIDCEILSLGQDQTEELLTQTGSIGAAQVALFAITGISATDYPSAAAADKARRAHSAAGQALLKKNAYPTLSLFPYEPSLGSVVDDRNLTVGG
jgi:hypothetical protein